MGIIGNLLGSAAGNYLGGRFLNNAAGGQAAGGALGSLLPFKDGGMVKPRRGKTQKAILHKGELVVPANLVRHVPKSLKSKIKKRGGRNM